MGHDCIDGAVSAAKSADLCLVLGSSCRVAPAAEFPALATRCAAVNLQATPLDGAAAVRIGARCDDVMARLLEQLGGS